MEQRFHKPFRSTRRAFSLGLGSGLVAAHRCLSAGNIETPLHKFADVTLDGLVMPLGPTGAWDSGAVGTPWIVVDPDDRKLRMYYVGAGERAAGLEEHAEAEASAVHKIGMAECDGEDLTVWRRFQI